VKRIARVVVWFAAFDPPDGARESDRQQPEQRTSMATPVMWITAGTALIGAVWAFTLR
jgi:hypothetical protein